MARLRGFSPRVLRSSPRRKSGWSVGPGGTAVTSVASSTAILVGGGIIATIDGLTAVRIRGHALFTLTSNTSAQDGFQGAFGIGIVELPAFTAGIGSVPTPITEQGSENWLYWTAVSLRGAAASSASLDGHGSIQRWDVDTKAMRKTDTAQVVYAALEVVEVGTAAAQFWFDSRCLSLLP